MQREVSPAALWRGKRKSKIPLGWEEIANTSQYTSPPAAPISKQLHPLAGEAGEALAHPPCSRASCPWVPQGDVLGHWAGSRLSFLRLYVGAVF